MLQQEFEQRVGMKVSPTEYNHIEQVYMASDVDKDTFCHLWAVMNRQRISKAKAEAKAKEAEEDLKSRLWNILQKFSNKDWMWRETHTTYGVLNKTERGLIEKAGMEIESGICPKLMSTMLWEVRQYLKAA